MKSNPDHGYWSGHSPLYDQLNCTCPYCHKGTLKERDFIDKYNGVVVCNECKKELPRWKWVVEFST